MMMMIMQMMMMTTTTTTMIRSESNLEFDNHYSAVTSPNRRDIDMR